MSEVETPLNPVDTSRTAPFCERPYSEHTVRDRGRWRVFTPDHLAPSAAPCQVLDLHPEQGAGELTREQLREKARAELEARKAARRAEASLP